LAKQTILQKLAPEDFQQQFTTLWSFPERGDWATHKETAHYRGNWSPYIPRNLILKYSKEGQTVLDCFCGAGTTAIEAKLLRRKCVAIDINEHAIKLTKRNLAFALPKEWRFYRPDVRVGDARDLSFLRDGSIDLICAHPPYANAIKYSKETEGDLSHLDVDEFLKQMSLVAQENFRVLKPGRCCAVLIGDLRRNRKVVPLAFMLMRVYLRAGFVLKEIIIKEQHNCKMTDAWREKSTRFNFLLLAHEYLPVFEKA
jgi:DNA modification methylase